MNYHIKILIILSLTSLASAQNYNPIHGNSSSRGVTYFDVPGSASIGTTGVFSFKKYSTGADRLRPRNTVRSPNPLKYYHGASKTMPKSGSGSIKIKAGQVNNRLSNQIYRNNLISSTGTTKKSGYGFTGGAFAGISTSYKSKRSIASIPLRIRKSPNPLLKRLTTSSSALMANRKKSLLQSSRKGRLAYSKVDLKRSLTNKVSRLTIGSRLSANKYSTSSILSNR